VNAPPQSAPRIDKATPSVVDTNPISVTERPRSIQKGLTIGPMLASPSLYVSTKRNTPMAPGRANQARNVGSHGGGAVDSTAIIGARETTAPSANKISAAVVNTAPHPAPSARATSPPPPTIKAAR